MRRHPIKTSVNRRRSSVNYAWVKSGCFIIAALGITFWLKHIDYKSLEHQFDRSLNVLTAKNGLVIEDIFIEGRAQEDPENIRNAIGLKKGDPLFQDSPDCIKQRLEILSWVRSASVQRVFPNLLYIKLVERQPIALWQYKGRLFLMDIEGKIIDSEKVVLFKHLPLFVGNGSNTAAAALIEKIKQYPLIKEHWATAIRMGERRWDLKFRNGLTVCLPEQLWEKALEELELLCQNSQVFKREIIGIDLRFPDRYALKLSTPGIVQARFHNKSAKNA